MESKLKEAEEELHNLDLMAESRNLNEMEITRKKEVLGVDLADSKKKGMVMTKKVKTRLGIKRGQEYKVFPFNGIYEAKQKHD